MRPLLFSILSLFRRQEKPSEDDLISYGRDLERQRTVTPALGCPMCHHTLVIHWHGYATWLLTCGHCKPHVIHEPPGQYFKDHWQEYDVTRTTTQKVARVRFEITPYQGIKEEEQHSGPLASDKADAFLNDSGADATEKRPVAHVLVLHRVHLQRAG